MSKPLTFEQKQHCEAIVREYPIKPGEAKLCYIARLAVEMGLVAPMDGMKRWPASEPMTEQEWADARQRAERDLPRGDRSEA